MEIAIIYYLEKSEKTILPISCGYEKAHLIKLVYAGHGQFGLLRTEYMTLLFCNVLEFNKSLFLRYPGQILN